MTDGKVGESADWQALPHSGATKKFSFSETRADRIIER